MGRLGLLAAALLLGSAVRVAGAQTPAVEEAADALEAAFLGVEVDELDPVFEAGGRRLAPTGIPVEAAPRPSPLPPAPPPPTALEPTAPPDGAGESPAPGTTAGGLSPYANPPRLPTFGR